MNWSGLVSLSLRYMHLMEGAMEKVLFGCPNLECLELGHFGGFHHLEISNVKQTKLIIDNLETDESDIWLEISAPYIQNLQLLGSCRGICLRNMASLVTTVLYFDFDFEDGDELMESGCLTELLHSIAHVENLELGPWCIEFLSILELEGWQSPPSCRKFVKLETALEQLDFPGICSFLQSYLILRH
ncbi:hypothetical protein HAX54_029035 [Datura stramonium]|uniref:F-box protein n=1 Tax=Datura stramonium TaxID=4076 RepID=A0ABS8V850_DATST|nr:hypothetical protein [Datura stramonium]